MKKFTSIFVIVMAIISQSAIAAFKLPDYQSFKLDNGLQVFLMQQSEVPMIDVNLTIKAGAIHDKTQLGLANLTGESLKFGSGSLSKTEVEDLLAFHGAELNATTSSEMSNLAISIAAKDQKKLLGLFSDFVMKPKFDDAEFAKYKKRFINQLAQMRESPRNIVGSVFDKMYYGDHPYGNPILGDASTVEKLKLSDVKSFYKNRFTPANSALVIVGDFDSKTMKKQVRKLFGDWQGKAPKADVLPLVNDKDEAAVWLVDKEDAIETTFLIGGKGINSDHPDFVAAQVINTILGGRFTSWLNDELRVNSGLTYGARSRFVDRSTAGNFVISTFTKTASTTEAIDLALKTYQKLWEKGIDEETLKSAKAYVKGQFPPRYETSGQLAALLSRMWALGLDASVINDFEQKVDSLDVTKANAIAKKIFPQNSLQFVLVGKASDIKDKVKKYGKIKELNINSFTY